MVTVHDIVIFFHFTVHALPQPSLSLLVAYAIMETPVNLFGNFLDQIV